MYLYSSTLPLPIIRGITGLMIELACFLLCFSPLVSVTLTRILRISNVWSSLLCKVILNIRDTSSFQRMAAEFFVDCRAQKTRHELKCCTINSPSQSKYLCTPSSMGHPNSKNCKGRQSSNDSDSSHVVVIKFKCQRWILGREKK